MTYSKPNKSGLGRKTWYTWPIIVPPILEKGSFIGEALDSVWRGAWEALINADRVVVYGYSFPEADQQSKGFFQRARAKMARATFLVTINPDYSARTRASEIFLPHVAMACDTVRAYLKFGSHVAIGA